MDIFGQSFQQVGATLGTIRFNIIALPLVLPADGYSLHRTVRRRRLKLLPINLISELQRFLQAVCSRFKAYASPDFLR
jgi:hypothetical protein